MGERCFLEKFPGLRATAAANCICSSDFWYRRKKLLKFLLRPGYHWKKI